MEVVTNRFIKVFNTFRPHIWWGSKAHQLRWNLLWNGQHSNLEKV
jgi:hypothetical protein